APPADDRGLSPARRQGRERRSLAFILLNSRRRADMPSARDPRTSHVARRTSHLARRTSHPARRTAHRAPRRLRHLCYFDSNPVWRGTGARRRAARISLKPHAPAPAVCRLRREPARSQRVEIESGAPAKPGEDEQGSRPEPAIEETAAPITAAP